MSLLILYNFVNFLISKRNCNEGHIYVIVSVCITGSMANFNAFPHKDGCPHFKGETIIPDITEFWCVH